MRTLFSNAAGATVTVHNYIYVPGVLDGPVDVGTGLKVVSGAVGKICTLDSRMKSRALLSACGITYYNA